MLAGRLDIAGQRTREAGFREVLAERYPRTCVTDVLVSGEDGKRAGWLAHRVLRSQPRARGISLSSAGAGPIVAALLRLGRAKGTILITHEMTPDRRALPRAEVIDAVINQNLELEARLAIEAVARLLGTLEGETTDVPTEIAIQTCETA